MISGKNVGVFHLRSPFTKNGKRKAGRTGKSRNQCENWEKTKSRGTCLGKRIGSGIYNSQTDIHIISGKFSLKGSSIQKIVAIRGFGFRQAVLQTGIEIAPFQNTVCPCGQAPVHNIGIGAAASDDGFRVCHGILQGTLRTPFQPEGGSRQRTAGNVDLLHSNLAGAQCIDKSYLGYFTLGDGDGLGVIALARIQAVL